MINRPKLNIEAFEIALKNAGLDNEELDIIEHIRYIGIFDELSLRKALNLPGKPPALVHQWFNEPMPPLVEDREEGESCDQNSDCDERPNKHQSNAVLSGLMKGGSACCHGPQWLLSNP